MKPPQTALKRKHEGLADFAQRDSRWLVLERGFETLDRFAETFETESERLVVHWHNVINTGRVTHGDRLFGCAVRSDPRIVGADRHDGDIVDAPIAQRGELIGESCVASENEAMSLALEDVAVVAAKIIVPQSCAPMFHSNCFYAYHSSGRRNETLFAKAQFRDIAKARPS